MRVSGVVGAVGLAVLAGSAQGQIVTDWVAGVGDNWSNPARWSGGVVPNNGVDEYRARILVPGVYTVTLDIDVTLSGFNLEAPSATFQFSGAGRSLTTSGTNVFDGAQIQGSPACDLTANGTNTLSGGGAYTGVSSFTLGGTADFIDGDDWDLCDTCLNLEADGDWQGTGGFNLDNNTAQSEIVIEAIGSLAVTGIGSRSVTSADSANKFINRGELSIEFGDALSTLSINGAGFINENGGKVTVKNGKLFTSTLDSLSGGALSGGNWRVEGGGEVDLGAATIQTLDTGVELVGAGSSFAALNQLATIGAAGTLAISEGRNFTTAGNLELQGTLRVGSGSALDVSGSVSAFNAGVLTSGNIELNGQILGDNTRADRVGGRLIVGLDGALLFRDNTTIEDGLAGLSRIDSGGTFGLVAGRELDLSVDNASFEVGGTLLLGSMSTEGPMNRGSKLAVSDYVQETGSVLQIGIGSTTDYGRIEAMSLTFGLGDPADLAGTLSLIVEPGVALAVGDEFLIFDLATPGGLFGSGFALLTSVGLGGGLSFEQFISLDGFGVRVVPAPMTAAVLLGGGLLASRRRRA